MKFQCKLYIFAYLLICVNGCYGNRSTENGNNSSNILHTNGICHILNNTSEKNRWKHKLLHI